MVYILIPTERTDINLMSSSSLSSYDQKVDSWLGFNQKRYELLFTRAYYVDLFQLRIKLINLIV